MDAPKGIESKKTRTSKIWKGKDGIIRILYFGVSDLDIADAMTDAGIVREYAGSTEHPLIVDTSSLRRVNQKTRKYLLKRENYTCLSAVAFIVHVGFFGRIFGKIPQIIKVPGTPTKSFLNEQDAIAWIKEVTSSQS